MKRRLGLNIDHIATLREARKVRYPNPLDALPILKKCRVDQVTLHLREDRRHIQDYDLERIVHAGGLPVNLEMAVTRAMVKVALRYQPRTCTFVPEKRQEVTTEGGLDCVTNADAVGRAVEKIQSKGIIASLFIDPNEAQIRMANRLGAEAIELHTGAYCDRMESYFLSHGTYRIKAGTPLSRAVTNSLQAIINAAALAKGLGLAVYAGHGLHVHNLGPIVKIPEIEEYNIGHAVIARAVFVGLEKAIREIQAELKG